MVSQPNATFPGQIWLRQPDGSHRLIPDTPENRQVVQTIELNAGMAVPKGDNASLSDFRQQYAGNLSPQGFRQFLQLHQCSPRHGIQLELEAAGQGLTVSGAMAKDPLQRKHIPLEDDERGTTYAPGMTTTREHEPRVPEKDDDDLSMAQRLAKKVKRILDSAALEGMQVSGGSSLTDLEEQGIIARGMGEYELYARLKRVMPREDASRLAFQAHEAGWFVAGVAPERTSGAHQWTVPTPNGDTFHEHNTDAPLRGHVPPGRIANVQALAEVRQGLDELRGMMEGWLREKRRELRGRVEG